MKKTLDKNINEVEVYKAYIKALATPNYSVLKLCKKLNIPRPTLYAIVDRIENGDEAQLQTCLTKTRLDCLWENKYKRRFAILEEIESEGGDSKQIARMKKSLIKDMREDDFGVREVARRLGKDPSTISFHLKSK